VYKTRLEFSNKKEEQLTREVDTLNREILELEQQLGHLKNEESGQSIGQIFTRVLKETLNSKND